MIIIENKPNQNQNQNNPIAQYIDIKEISPTKSFNEQFSHPPFLPEPNPNMITYIINVSKSYLTQ